MIARHSALVSTLAPVMARFLDEATGGLVLLALGNCKYFVKGLTFVVLSHEFCEGVEETCDFCEGVECNEFVTVCVEIKSGGIISE